MAILNYSANKAYYDAAQRFVDAALRSDDSLFTPGRPIWSLATINKLHHDFVEQPDESSRSFEVKFKDQLAQSDPDTIQLAGEVLYVHFLPANGILPDTKRRQINTVLSWSSAPVGIPKDLDQALNQGIAKRSQAFLFGRPFQLWLLIDFARAWKQLALQERDRALADPWEFKRIVFGIPFQFAYAQRELLLYLVHPDSFEPTMAHGHKALIAKSFANLVDTPDPDVDRQILQIRRKLSAQYGRDFTFYEPAIKKLWEGGLPQLPGGSRLPRSLGPELRPYVQLVTHLTGSNYTAEQIVTRLGQISPPIVPLTKAPDPEELVRDLLHLRLLKPLESGNYRRWSHLDDATVEHMLRYAALTLLVPAEEGDDEYELPILHAHFDTTPRATDDWPIGQDLLSWYAEAKLVRRNEDGTWQSLPGALGPIDADTSTAQALNTFLANLQYVRASPYDLPPLEDGPLAQLPPEVLEQRIAEIQRELLIDRSTILRIYRSLIAGHHVILSGPPGTGKTHLARRLPQVFWRDIKETALLRMPITPELPPTASPVEEIRQREGYHAEVVTATEDWGVRDVIGGIVPQLQRNGETRSLLYSVRHGCLTRTMLANYAGYDGALVPPTFYRNEIRSGDLRYRGRWLVIDEFTRAPIDAAFGSLLTVLGGQHTPTLAVPTDDGVDASIPLPRDFRVIGTLNSFDRHFLNQISEAMKRRFTFIDVLPPSRAYAEAEQAMAIYRALVHLARQRMPGLTADEIVGQADWKDVLSVRRVDVPGEQFTTVQYRVEPIGDIAQVLASFWRIFTGIRVYRQLGTAQAEAVYTELFAGRSIGLSWSEALDTALADVLADQLQVLARDEQRVLIAFLEQPQSAEHFATAVSKIMEKLPGQRQMAHLSQLRAADPVPENDPIDDMDVVKLQPAQLARLFDLGVSLVIDPNGLFTRRLRAFVNERGL